MNQNDLMQYWYAYIYDRQVVQDDVQHIISMVGDSPLKILEVACGSGRISIPLAKKGHLVTGFDVDEAALARIPNKARLRARFVETNFLEHKKADGLPNLNCFRADAISDDWGSGFDVVILSGNVLVNIITDGDYKQAQELFIQKAASCVKQGGYLYLDFTCANWPDFTCDKVEERVIFEGTDDRGTYGKFVAVSGDYSSETRIDKSTRRYEITPKGREMFTATKEVVKHFPTHQQVVSWLEKYGWEIEWHNPIEKETFHAIIWAKKK